MTKLEKILTDTYEKKGIDYVYQVCRELLKVKDNSKKKPLVNGDVCETLLVLLTKQYIKDRNIHGNCVRSIVLKDPDNLNSDFRTEIDFLFYTPKLIFCTECKSYAGPKTITDKCTLSNGRYSCDIFSQNMIHLETLYKNIRGFKIDKSKKLYIALSSFMFSNGDIVDKRDKSDKALLPIITQDTLYKFYDKMLKDVSINAWDYRKVDYFLQKLEGSVKLHEEHKRYLGY